MLLSRVADRIYWAARYIERAEDTARIVRAHAETTADLPAHVPVSWKPLVAVVGSGARFESRSSADVSPSPRQSQSQSQSQGPGGPSQSQHQGAAPTFERAVTAFLVTDRTNPGSITSCVSASRENLRTTRETIPRDGWHTLNDLHLYVTAEADRGTDRRIRDRLLSRVIADSRRLDGVLATAMSHDEAYAMWRLGRAIERADMTTRVLGVRAADVLAMGDNPGQDDADLHDEVQWMGVLRSVSAMQAYGRAVRSPIEGPLVVRFLLDHDRFPRSVRALLREIRMALNELPDPGGPQDVVDEVGAVLRESTAASTDGAALDDAMDALQLALGQLDRRITERYLRVG